MAFDPISAGLGLANTIIEKLFPDKTKQEEAKAALKMADLTNEFQLFYGQIQTNIEEAKSASVFVAGWRPAVGWVCAAGFAWQYFLGPLAMFTLNAFGLAVSLPALEASELMTILLGMLGLAGMRSYDKGKGNGKD
jgi:hypothetical protein